MAQLTQALSLLLHSNGTSLKMSFKLQFYLTEAEIYL